MNLVIVESPTKARKLSSYLGSEYTVEASVGHIRDLPKSKLGVDVEKEFEPIYQVPDDKAKVVKNLQSLAKKATQVYLATDPDREGEAIAWHIQYLLKPSAKKEAGFFKRATFHEITKNAVMEAIEHPTIVNMDLVNAQQARRVVDRLVGYKLSPVLWKKVRRGLSAGRVQSAALRLIVEREKEIQAFKPEEYWEVDVLMDSVSKGGKKSEKNEYRVKNAKGEWEFVKELPADFFIGRVISINGKTYEPKTSADVIDVVAELEKAEFTVVSVEKKERRRSSLPPFSTSLLQQAAANRLGYSGKQTMTLAQQLYEEGLITYHRTDSFNLSTGSIDMARNYIAKNYGEQYLPASARMFATKSKNAQEAHEAIRVTDVMMTGTSLRQAFPRFGEQHVKLYDLIWRRFLASQMDSAVYDSTTVLTEGKATHTYTLKTTGSTLKFDGWMKLFPNAGDVILPQLTQGQKVDEVEINDAQKFTQPPARYNDGSLIKTLEEKGIGRPSTYASIISVIVDRGYVERKEKRFFATPIGITVNDFLVLHFPTQLDFQFTAEMEENLDRVARGEADWKKVLSEFYLPFEKTLEAVEEKAERMQVPAEETGEKCPMCGDTDGGKVVIRSGRFGKFRSCDRFPECKFTEAIVETVEGVKCPLCHEGDVVVKNTRWGKPFFGCGRYPNCDWASWKKPEADSTITQAEWDVMKAERAERIAKRKATFAAKGEGKAAPKKTVKKKAKRKTSKKKVTAK